MGVESRTLGDKGRALGRYVLFDEIATGGMATVHLGRLVGPEGFSRTVAIKKLHPQFAKDADFVAMFLDEARIAARIRHPNVVPTIDIVSEDGEIFLVMDYVQGESLSRLIKKSVARQQLPPPPIVAWIVAGILHGLHAAHEARSEQGEPLHIIHRDVSPQNILVGTDGTPRLLDFGVAKAAERTQTTRAGQVKGKIAYMSPEQIGSDQIDRRTDIYAAGVVLWEALTGLRLFQGANEGRIVHLILSGDIRPPSELAPGLPPELDAIVMKALASDPRDRFQTAREMAMALEESVRLATPSTVGGWVESLAHELLHERAGLIADIESRSDVFVGSGVRAADMNAMPTAPAPFVPPPLDSLLQHGAQPPAAPTSAPAVAPQGAPTSAPLVASVDPSEMTFAPNPAWKKRAMIGGVILGFAALVAIFAALVSALRTPTVVVQKTAPPQETTTSAPTSTVAAMPPPTTNAASVAKDDKVLTLPSATVTAKPKPTSAPVFVAPVLNCNPPFTIDKQGIRHPKPECL